jgi:hypothetical protein
MRCSVSSGSVRVFSKLNLYRQGRQDSQRTPRNHYKNLASLVFLAFVAVNLLDFEKALVVQYSGISYPGGF